MPLNGQTFSDSFLLLEQDDSIAAGEAIFILDFFELHEVLHEDLHEEDSIAAGEVIFIFDFFELHEDLHEDLHEEDSIAAGEALLEPPHVPQHDFSLEELQVLAQLPQQLLEQLLEMAPPDTFWELSHPVVGRKRNPHETMIPYVRKTLRNFLDKQHIELDPFSGQD